MAQDSPDFPPEVLEKIRQEIVTVVSRYAEIDDQGWKISLESNQQTTSLIANLPIRRNRPLQPEVPVKNDPTVECLDLDLELSDEW
jgi:cell division topological specificity factor